MEQKKALQIKRHSAISPPKSDTPFPIPFTAKDPLVKDRHSLLALQLLLSITKNQTQNRRKDQDDRISIPHRRYQDLAGLGPPLGPLFLHLRPGLQRGEGLLQVVAEVPLPTRNAGLEPGTLLRRIDPFQGKLSNQRVLFVSTSILNECSQKKHRT